MASGLLARRRVLTACLCLAGALGMGAGGCGAAGTNAVTVSGKTLTIYLSAPRSLSADPQAQDVIDAERLAFNQLKGEVQDFTLRLRVVTAKKVSDNARAAIKDTTAIAYLGEVQPGSSTDSLGITNAQDVLQVSPAAAASVPEKDFESFSTYSRTFASMAPSQDPQALLAGSAGKAFVDDFHGSYGHAPSTQAVFGYLATAAVLKALHNAGSAANNRGTVHDRFFALKHVPLLIGSAGPQLGTYTVNAGGTVTITPAAAAGAP
jgi:hypothetical protein